MAALHVAALPAEPQHHTLPHSTKKPRHGVANALLPEPGFTSWMLHCFLAASLGPPVQPRKNEGRRWRHCPPISYLLEVEWTSHKPGLSPPLL